MFCRGKVSFAVADMGHRKKLSPDLYGGSFQRKAEQWSRDYGVSAKSEAPLGSMTFEHLFAENEAPLTFNQFSDEYEAALAFKRPLAGNEASPTCTSL